MTRNFFLLNNFILKIVSNKTYQKSYKKKFFGEAIIL